MGSPISRNNGSQSAVFTAEKKRISQHTVGVVKERIINVVFAQSMDIFLQFVDRGKTLEIFIKMNMMKSQPKKNINHIM